MIYVLNNGVIEEQGTHETLIKLAGYYCALYKKKDKGGNYVHRNI